MEKCKNIFNESWKDVVGYEGVYQISNKRRVKSFKRKKEKILIPQKNNARYYRVRLYINRKAKNWFVHRLVALSFIPNTDNLPIINHKDENRLNNCVENLEWCTYKYNSNYRYKNANSGC